MIRLKRLQRHHALILHGSKVLAHCLRGTEKLWYVLSVGKKLVYLAEVGPQETVEDSLMVYIKKVYCAPKRKAKSRQKLLSR